MMEISDIYEGIFCYGRSILLFGMIILDEIILHHPKQVSFIVTAEEMMLYDTKWFIPTTEYKVFVGGQQPNQQTSAPSNVLDGSFTVQA